MPAGIHYVRRLPLLLCVRLARPPKGTQASPVTPGTGTVAPMRGGDQFSNDTQGLRVCARTSAVHLLVFPLSQRWKRRATIATPPFDSPRGTRVRSGQALRGWFRAFRFTGTTLKPVLTHTTPWAKLCRPHSAPLVALGFAQGRLSGAAAPAPQPSGHAQGGLCRAFARRGRWGHLPLRGVVEEWAFGVKIEKRRS